MSLFNPGEPTLFDRIGILVQRQFNQFRDFSVDGLDGGGRSVDRFGLKDHHWGEIEKLAEGLPWSVQHGLLNASDVNDAKGDLDALKAQRTYWREYGKTQRESLDVYLDVREEQLQLAKAMLKKREEAAQIDLKASDAVYRHRAQTAIYTQQDANNADLSRLQQELGIKLENSKHGNNRNYLNAEYDQEVNLDSARHTAKRQSLTERYTARLESIRNPARRESEFTPTPGRVLRFGRRAS
jgi:hypothetical protein